MPPRSCNVKGRYGTFQREAAANGADHNDSQSDPASAMIAVLPKTLP
jgi:hypothetical protein